MNDGINHDDECEWASEACGCVSREKLREEIFKLKRTLALLKTMLPAGYEYKTYAIK